MEDLEAIFGILGFVWLVITVWWVFSTAGSLRRIADTQEKMYIEMLEEDEA